MSYTDHSETLSNSIWDYISLYMDINENEKDKGDNTTPSSLYLYQQANEQPLVSVDQSKRSRNFSPYTFFITRPRTCNPFFL
jgi:hypothetical protein